MYILRNISEMYNIAQRWVHNTYAKQFIDFDDAGTTELSGPSTSKFPNVYADYSNLSWWSMPYKYALCWNHYIVCLTFPEMRMAYRKFSEDAALTTCHDYDYCSITQNHVRILENRQPSHNSSSHYFEYFQPEDFAVNGTRVFEVKGRPFFIPKLSHLSVSGYYK